MQKNIRKIAPLLAESFLNFKVDAEYRRNYYRSIKDKKELLGDFYDLMGNWYLHDSLILQNKTIDDIFHLILSDNTTHTFAKALAEQQDIAFDDTQQFKLAIEFLLNSEVEYFIIQPGGELEPSKPVELSEFLDTQFLMAKGSKKLAIIATSTNEKRYLLVIDIQATKVIFNQRQDWQQLFGNTYDVFYERFQAMLKKGHFLGDQNICEELIEKWTNSQKSN